MPLPCTLAFGGSSRVRQVDRVRVRVGAKGHYCGAVGWTPPPGAPRAQAGGSSGSPSVWVGGVQRGKGGGGVRPDMCPPKEIDGTNAWRCRAIDRRWLSPSSTTPASTPLLCSQVRVKSADPPPPLQSPPNVRPVPPPRGEGGDGHQLTVPPQPQFQCNLKKNFPRRLGCLVSPPGGGGGGARFWTPTTPPPPPN